MRRSALFLCLTGLVLALASPAHAQATRTWVSGVGDDANPCSRTAPCKTFAGAISKTAAGGEINVLDPGGFGALTITKAISVYDDGVGEGGVLVSGSNGIVINAGANDTVNLRGLVIDGLGTTAAGTSLSGVLVLTAGHVTIMNCVIQGMGESGGSAPQAGVSIATSVNTSVKIIDTTMIGNFVGVWAKPTGGTTYLSIDRSRIDNNFGAGVRIDGSGGGTVLAGINDSSMSLNAANGLVSVSGPGSVTTNVMRDSFVGNQAFGVSVTASGGNSTVTVGNSMLANNVAGALNFSGSGATLQTYQAGTNGTNQIVGANGTGFSGGIALQ